MRGSRGKWRTEQIAGRALAVVLFALVTLSAAPPAAADITYLYDELGRLIGVVDPSSDTAVYSYDAVGNLLGIARHASSTVSIIDFQPKSGPVGTVVTIQGTGFSPTPGSNAVTFNGTAATVTSSTATSIVVPVPSGATSGQIAVTAPGGSATSAASFTVTGSSGAPVITSFSPAVGLPGATTTISGSNFEPVPASNRVTFNGVPRVKTSVSAATTTSLDALVPTGARSGPLTVSTPAGTATSAADFFVPTGGFTAAQVSFTGRITVGGASVDAAVTSNTIGLVVFDGVAGQRLNLGTIQIAGPPSPLVTIYQPDGAVLPTTGHNSPGIARYTAPLPMTGVYVIEVRAQTFGYTVRLTLSEEVVGTGQIGGSGVGLTISRAGQRARVSFPGTAGQYVDLGLTHSFGGVNTAFRTEAETTLVLMGIGSPGELHSPALPSTATYYVMVEPSGTTGNFTATLSEAVTASISTGGSSVPVSITRAGQQARLTFAGTSGQALRVGVTSATHGGTVSVYRPDGSTHMNPTGFSAPAAGLDIPVLTVTGNYTMVVNLSAEPSSATLTLSEWVTGTTAMTGTPATLNITRPGQAGYLSFSATAGQRVSHVVSGTTISGTMVVYNPSVGVIQSGALPGTTFLDTATTSVTGTYYIYVFPTAANTGSTTVTSYQVTDATGSLTINGGTAPVTLSTPGQNAGLTFSATSGQGLTAKITGNAVGCISVSIVPPPGGSIGSTSSCSGTFNLTGSVVTTTGTHTLRVNPTGAATGSVTVEVTNP